MTGSEKTTLIARVVLCSSGFKANTIALSLRKFEAPAPFRSVGMGPSIRHIRYSRIEICHRKFNFRHDFHVYAQRNGTCVCYHTFATEWATRLKQTANYRQLLGL